MEFPTVRSVRQSARRNRMRAVVSATSGAVVAALVVVIAAAPADAGTQTGSNPTSMNLPAGGTAAPDHSPSSLYPSPITIAGLTDTVTNVTVRLLDLTHNNARDLDIWLVGPTGARSVVMSDVGHNNRIDTPIDLTFTDGAATSAPDGPLVDGATYRPTDLTNGFNVDTWPAPAPAGPYGTSFAAFNGTNPNGTWNLYVVDDANGDQGTLAGGWSLTVDTGAASFPGQLQFSDVEYRGTEGGGVATVTVSRVNGDDGAVGVTVATGTGSATAGSDYTPVSTTLAFADGQSSRTVDIPIADDAVVEGIDELVPLTLSSVTGGATLGSPTSANVRIQDNDASENRTAIDVPATGSVNNLGAARPYPSTVAVTGAGGVVTDVNLTMTNLTHTHVRDMDVLLVAPNGAATRVMGDVGPNTPVSGLTLTFDDEAPGTISQSALTSGSYRPSQFDDELPDTFPSPAPAGPWGTTLAALDGSSPNGQWRLFVFDDAGGDVGSIAGGWSLALTTATASAGGPYTTTEGAGVTLQGSTSPAVAGATYEWDVDGDGQYDDATGADPTVSAATLAAIGLGDGPDSSSLRVRATAGSAVITSTATTLTVTNVRPTASLGNNGPVPLGDSATVSFSGQADPSTTDAGAGFRYSYDFDNDLDYEVGDGTYAGGSTSASATVPATVLDREGDFTVRGVIVDKDGGSSPYTTTVHVDPPPNVAPNAAAGADRTVAEGASVTLDGTGSSDPESGALGFSWVQTAGPAVTLTGANTAQPTFTAPTGPATLTFEVTVTDPEGATDTDTVTITVNAPPAAAAGADRTVTEGASVTLDGTGSSDPESGALGFSWVQTAGPSVTLTGANTAQPTFTAPTGPATLTFEVTVTDPEGATDTDTVTITVNGSARGGCGCGPDGHRGCVGDAGRDRVERPGERRSGVLVGADRRSRGDADWREHRAADVHRADRSGDADLRGDGDRSGGCHRHRHRDDHRERPAGGRRRR